MPGVTATRIGRVVRMGADTPAEIRDMVARVVRDINDAAGVGLTIGPNANGPPTADEIVVRVTDQTICGPIASGCTSNAIAQSEGFGVVTNAVVEIQRDLLGSGYELPVLLHEMGHAMGLGHYNEPYGTQMQVMWGFVTPEMTSYRSGDRNGLRALAAAFANPGVIGIVDQVRQEPGGIRVAGWTVDVDDPPAQLAVTALVGSVSRTDAVANLYRSDVEAAVPQAGPNHGFEITAPTPAQQQQFSVCVNAVGFRGQEIRVNCRVLAVEHQPIGRVDSATVTAPGTVRVTGWAIDPDTANAITVHIDVNGRRSTTVTADRQRNDVGLAKPGYGPNHGFDVTLRNIPGGRHQICATGVDQTGHANRQLGCRSVTTPGGNPFGRVDRLAPSWVLPTEVHGWAIDPDTADPITVHMYVDNRFAGSAVANRSRPDVGRAFPGYGDRHGYHLRLPRLPRGPHRACVYGINVGTGNRNPLLGCINYTVPGGIPFGVLDRVRVRAGRAEVQGWTIDPDTASPIAVHVYVNDRLTGFALANVSRPDVGRAFPGYGDRHGFNLTAGGLRSGVNRVCVFAINVGFGNRNPLLGCASVRR
jgi:hypothetical protein